MPSPTLSHVPLPAPLFIRGSSQCPVGQSWAELPRMVPMDEPMAGSAPWHVILFPFHLPKKCCNPSQTSLSPAEDRALFTLTQAHSGNVGKNSCSVWSRAEVQCSAPSAPVNSLTNKPKAIFKKFSIHFIFISRNISSSYGMKAHWKHHHFLENQILVFPFALTRSTVAPRLQSTLSCADFVLSCRETQGGFTWHYQLRCHKISLPWMVPTWALRHFPLGSSLLSCLESWNTSEHSTGTTFLLDNTLTEPAFGIHWIILKNRVT